jgi:hypothetical protein
MPIKLLSILLVFVTLALGVKLRLEAETAVDPDATTATTKRRP